MRLYLNLTSVHLKIIPPVDAAAPPLIQLSCVRLKIAFVLPDLTCLLGTAFLSIPERLSSPDRLANTNGLSVPESGGTPIALPVASVPGIVVSVPEPGTFMLFGLGLVSLFAFRGKRSGSAVADWLA